MKLKTHIEDSRIPDGYAVREFDEEVIPPEVRNQGRWVARHQHLEDDPSCDWYSREKSYAAAVMATRVHEGFQCSARLRKSRKSR